MKRILCSLALGLVMVLAGCGQGTKQDIMDKAKDVKTKEELEKVLGKPDRVNSIGLAERWTYKGSDGDVNFNIVGGKVMVTDTIGGEKK